MRNEQEATKRGRRLCSFAIVRSSFLISSLCLCASVVSSSFAQDRAVLEAEAQRVAAIEKVRPAVVAVFARGGRGGGSGALISKDGYALTNFHVIQPVGPVMQCGLADGVLYDAVLVGNDPVGDIALIRLLPPKDKPDFQFPFAELGDSDKVQAGDWAMAMGNPFLLATDFSPTITFGMVSGVHRYQEPSGVILEYTDCIQIDASINPGNSGGPLFNMQGEIIGINGRGSFEKRGRVNSGVGYAISSNQIKHFLGHLKAGLLVDHATLGAQVRTEEDGRLIVQRILEDSDAFRRGLDTDDEVLGFAGRQVQTVNQYKNVLGIYPRGWRLPLTFRRKTQDGEVVTKEILVRLRGVLPAGADPTKPKPQQPRPRPMPEPKPGEPKPEDWPKPGEPMPMPGAPPPPPPDSPATKLYEAKAGFANHHFNKLERERLWQAFQKHGDFSALAGAWTVEADAERPKKVALQAVWDDAAVKLKFGATELSVRPLDVDEPTENLREPRGSGGLMVALYHWRRLLVQGEKGFEGHFAHGGVEPYYPLGTPESRVDALVLNTEYAGVAGKWFFSPKDQSLLGFECYVDKDRDPCEVAFFDYKEVDGRKLPQRIAVRYADKEFGVYSVKSYKLAPSVEKTP
jgi:serine protease Do